MSEPLDVRLFAGPAQELRSPSVRIMPARLPCTVDELLGELVAAHPVLTPYRRSLLVAVNRCLARPHDPINIGDEVAVFSALAGG
jgi:molybdopterin converting factor small subunit